MSYDPMYRTEWPGGYIFGQGVIYKGRPAQVCRLPKKHKTFSGQVFIIFYNAPCQGFFVPADDIEPSKVIGILCTFQDCRQVFYVLETARGKVEPCCHCKRKLIIPRKE